MDGPNWPMSPSAQAGRVHRDPGLHLADRGSVQRRGSMTLNLSASTWPGIFAGDITKWNDCGDRGGEPGREVCLTRDIVVVHRSDESGTTENFTDYLHQAAPGLDRRGPTGSGRSRAARLPTALPA